MRESYYLKNIILILKDGKEFVHFVTLIEKLLADGISVNAYLTGEEISFPDEALYITDCGLTANHLSEKKLPVLAYLRRNAGENPAKQFSPEGDSFKEDSGEARKEDFAGIEYAMECPEDVDTRYLDRIYRRYRDIPWDILTTERCVLRETKVEDVDSFYKIYAHPEIVRYTEELYPDTGREKAYIREYIDKVYRYFEFGVWTVLQKETGQIIGRAGFSVREGYELPELGFVIGVPWQGQGIAYEICRAILRYGEEEFGFGKVQALVSPENTVSLALCHKLGFLVEKRVKENQKEYFLLIRESEAGKEPC